MKVKKIISYIIVVILGVVLLNLVASAQIRASEFASRMKIDGMILWHIYAGVFAFLFGVLLEWHTIVKLLKREIRPGYSWLHICAILMLIISFIPPVIFITNMGIRFPFTYRGSSLIVGALSHTSVVQKILSVVAGSFIIKGLSHKAYEISR